MTETLIAISAFSYGADVLERVYHTRGDALHARMSLATPWDDGRAMMVKDATRNLSWNFRTP